MRIEGTPTKRRRQGGFTLIELLTTISIIAVLAAVAGPALNAAMEMAKMSSAMQKARQIGLGLRAYATDNGGMFPTGENDLGESISTSNAAFRDLYDYIDDERIYAVAGSAWGSEADSQDPYCSAGECHFAYVSGLTTTAKSWWPLVTDGSDGTGTFTRKIGERGGLWKGKKVVVTRIDGSAESVKLKGQGETRFMPRLDKPEQNALDVSSYMGSRVEFLDPEG